jgi:hypothetical protein
MVTAAGAVLLVPSATMPVPLLTSWRSFNMPVLIAEF